MLRRPLGNTGLVVSGLAIGTVSLGLDYGLPDPSGFGKPSEHDAVNLLRTAAEKGINLYDTAPAYGDAERLLGLAFGNRDDIYVATKISVPLDSAGKRLHGKALSFEIRESLVTSLNRLDREVLDIVQIHNATTELLAEGEIQSILLEARKDGLVRFVGASVYGEPAASAVVSSGAFQVLQVAVNLLDQRMFKEVLPAASRAKIGVLARSALLKGVLSSKAASLPQALARLRSASDRAREALEATWEGLPSMALRYCMSRPEISATLAGTRTISELHDAIAAANAGPLPDPLLARTPALALNDEALLDPSTWPDA